MQFRLIDRRRHLVADRRHGLQIGDHGIEVAGGKHLVESIRHDRRKLSAIRTLAFQHSTLDVVAPPFTNAGLIIRGDVGALDGEGRLIKRLRPARKLLRDVEHAAGTSRRVAIAALERSLRESGTGCAQYNYQSEKSAADHCSSTSLTIESAGRILMPRALPTVSAIKKGGVWNAVSVVGASSRRRFRLCWRCRSGVAGTVLGALGLFVAIDELDHADRSRIAVTVAGL